MEYKGRGFSDIIIFASSTDERMTADDWLQRYTQICGIFLVAYHNLNALILHNENASYLVFGNLVKTQG